MSGIDRINNNRIYSGEGKRTHSTQSAARAENNSFAEALASAKITLSKHAQLRMDDRRISLNPVQMNKLGNAVKKARDKGIRDTLILMDDKVFVVNVKSSTVITAVSGKDTKERVFTNIDGAVIV